MSQPPLTAPHALGTDEVLDHLEADTRGLSSEHAAELLERYGPNELRQAEPETVLQRLFRQINDPMRT